MSFLTTLPQDWSRPELNELRDLCVLAYRRPTAAEQIADAVDIVPGTFPWHDTMRTTWTELIKVLGNQGKLRALVQVMADDPTASAYAPRFRDMLAARPALERPQPGLGAAGGWKGDDLLPAVAARIYPERLMERRTRLLDVTLARQITTAALSVAKLTLRFPGEEGYGTAFLIDRDRVLTNYHNVVDATLGEVTNVVAEFDFEQGFSGAGLVRQGVLESIVGDPQHDWAVIRLETPVERPPLKLGTVYGIGIDDTVVIIQHPKGAFKQFALEPLAIRHVDDGVVQYVADTQQGSSGSPVFNRQMEVIALHHAEAETTVSVDGTEQTVWRNEGIHFAQVAKGLSAHSVSFGKNF